MRITAFLVRFVSCYCFHTVYCTLDVSFGIRLLVWKFPKHLLHLSLLYMARLTSKRGMNGDGQTSDVYEWYTSHQSQYSQDQHHQDSACISFQSRSSCHTSLMQAHINLLPFMQTWSSAHFTQHLSHKPPRRLLPSAEGHGTFWASLGVVDPCVAWAFRPCVNFSWSGEQFPSWIVLSFQR